MGTTKLDQIRVGAVIELAIKSFAAPEHTRGRQLAQQLLTQVKVNHYIETPDGWFIPLADLLLVIEEVADFLYHEAASHGEFDCCGGLEFWAGDTILLQVPLTSNFRFARDFGAAILRLQNDGTPQKVFIGNDDLVRLFNEDDKLIIEPVHPRSRFKGGSLRVPRDAAANETMNVMNEIDTFVQRLLAGWSKYDLSARDRERAHWALGGDLEKS